MEVSCEHDSHVLIQLEKRHEVVGVFGGEVIMDKQLKVQGEGPVLLGICGNYGMGLEVYLL